MANILDPVLNFAIVTVSIGYDASATSIALTAGHGARLPAPGTVGAFNLTWWNITDYPNPEDDPNVEIIRVTGRSTDTLTVTRAQEGTSGSTKNTAAKVYKMVLSPTKKLRDDIETNITAATGAEVDTGTDDTKKVTAKAIEDSAYVKAAYVDAKVSDTAYDQSSWDGVTTIAPSKNAVRDKIETMVIPVKATAAELIAGTDDAKFATALGLYGSVALGWFALGACTYETADAPTFTFSIASDVTGLLSVGQRIKLTQTTVKYFIITAVGAFSAGKTIITVYGGTDYTLANAAITVPYFSLFKAPFGFPLDPLKWTVRVTDTSDRNTATPSASTWTNLNAALTITFPIGTWDIRIQGRAAARKASINFSEVKVTLSTGNNTESDKDFTAAIYEEYTGTSASHAIHLPFNRQKTLTFATKTQYYLNAWTSLSSGNLLQIDGSTSTTIMEARCSFL